MPTKTEFNFSEWVETAKQFLKGVNKFPGEAEVQVKVVPPLSRSAVDKLQAKLSRPVPGPVRAFLEAGSGGVRFRYQCCPTGAPLEVVRAVLDGRGSVSGAAELCPASQFAAWLEECESWAEDTWIADSPKNRAFWMKSFPILRMRNGDFLAIDCRKPSQNPPVVYLSHEETSKIIARNFTAFLREWALVGYLGPESWMIKGCIGKDGYLSSETGKAKKLRGVFTNAG